MNLNSKFNYRDFIIFIVPVLIFSLYLYIYNPGILTAASFSQLHQIATGEFTGAYPILHTIIEMICLKIYASPASIGAFQILVFSLIWMLICNYHRDDTKSDSNGFVLQFIITMIVCLIPINAIYSITLSSNILFSYAVLFLSFLIKVIIDRNGQISSKLAIMIAVTLAFISGLSTFGIYVSVLSLVIIMAYLFIKKTPQDALIKLGLISVVCIVLITSIGMIYQTDANNNFPANDAFILDGLLNSPIVYVILSIILLGFIYYTTDSHEIFLIFIPNLLNMVICLVSGQNNLYSNLLVCYLIIIILANIWPNLKSQGTETPAPARTEQPARVMSQPKEYVPPKAEMNQPQEEYQTVDYQLEELTLDEGTNQRIEYEDGGSDFVDEILNEIKNEKK